MAKTKPTARKPSTVKVKPIKKAPSSPAPNQDSGYAELSRLVSNNIKHVDPKNVFMTDVNPDKLWDIYLKGLPAGPIRQYYTCHCCRRFIQRYGRLASVNGDGLLSVLFDGVSVELSDESYFKEIAKKLNDAVRSADLLSPFVWGKPDTTWGWETSGGWDHLSGTPDAAPYAGKLLTPGQRAAELRQNCELLERTIGSYPTNIIDSAVFYLKSGKLSRPEKALGEAEWLQQFSRHVQGRGGRKRRNMIWAETLQVPDGYAHTKNNVLGTLLDSIHAGDSSADVVRKWDEKLGPLQYQRPTAPVTAGQAKAAEDVVKTLKCERSLLRRYARLGDVLKFVWQPDSFKPTAKAKKGMFDHVVASSPLNASTSSPTNITWAKFSRDILPLARKLDVMLLSKPMSFFGLTTTVDYASPGILQWDELPNHPRNPVGYFFYNGGSHATRWGLSAYDKWVEVTGVFKPPHQWQEPDKFKHFGDMVMFALKGCVNTVNDVGVALFPEMLKAEFRAIRGVLDAHSNSRAGKLEEASYGNANGLAFSGKTPVTVRVNGVEQFTLDRME